MSAPTRLRHGRRSPGLVEAVAQWDVTRRLGARERDGAADPDSSAWPPRRRALVAAVVSALVVVVVELRRNDLTSGDLAGAAAYYGVRLFALAAAGRAGLASQGRNP